MNELANKSELKTEVADNAIYSSGNIIKDMREAYNLATVFCKAEIIPDAYKNRPSDCMIAIDMASRMGVSPLMVMQSLYVVKGKPSWSGSACMSFIQAHPNFKDVTPVYVGAPGTDQRGCFIQAVRVSDGLKIQGTCVTMAMAKAEGWTKNSKWFSMTDQMLGYRASSFFARIYCPAVLMGVAVEGEIEDITQNNINNNRKVESPL